MREANLHWRYVDGEIIAPWYTLPALQWLKSQDVSKWNVFEYGCGYSTIWWRLNCDIIKSVDSSKEWAKAMGAKFVPEKEVYIKECAYLGTQPYDCIIIDGEHREECTEFCLPYLKPGGFLIIDNWKEPGGFNCDKIIELLKDWPFVEHKQPNHSNWITAIFQKP